MHPSNVARELGTLCCMNMTQGPGASTPRAPVNASGDARSENGVRNGMAAAWSAALADRRDYALSHEELSQLLLRLTDRLVEIVSADTVAVDRASVVGAEVAEASVVSARALGRTLDVLVRDLLDAAGLCGDDVDARARLAMVCGAVATGYVQAVRSRMFAQQEAIRSAEVDVRSQLRTSEASFRAVFDNAAVGIGVSDMGGRIVDVNRAFADMLGYTVEEFRRHLVTEFVNQRADPTAQRLYADLAHGRRDHVRLEWPYTHRDGSTVWTNLTISLIRDADGRPQQLLAMAEDVSEQRTLRKRLEHQARHDALTGLPNRVVFMDRLRSAVELGEGRVGVCYLDLDGFKPVNDSLGHDVGDELLGAVARRLEQAADEHLVARLGGDEFAMLVEDTSGVDRVLALATAAQRALAEPFAVAGHRVVLNASVGVVERPVVGTTPADVMKAADVTLYWAKDAGSGHCEVYDEERSRRDSNRLALASRLPGALARDEFVIDYAPIVSTDDGVIRGAEALVRWQHPHIGRVPPDQFIRIAEDTGAIVALGRAVLERACSKLQQWRRAAPERELFISVNVSVRQLHEHDLVDEVAAVLRNTGLPASSLQLELTESAVMGPPGRPLEALQALDDMGVRIAVDDFGTGYSNLVYLHTLPLDTLKLDAAFVRPLSRLTSGGEKARAVTAALVRLAHDLDLDVVAEGVRDDTQVEQLRLLGCDLAQGSYFSPAVNAAGVGRLLGRQPLPVGSTRRG